MTPKIKTFLAHLQAIDFLLWRPESPLVISKFQSNNFRYFGVLRVLNFVLLLSGNGLGIGKIRDHLQPLDGQNRVALDHS